MLTRRRADLRRHAGEISFPGGRRDAEDANLADTALREAEEEIGLPRAQVSLLGELPQTSTFATNYVIHPFVATIPAGVAWRLSPRRSTPCWSCRSRTCARAAREPRMERRGHHLRNRRLHRRRPPHLGRDRPHPRAPLRAPRWRRAAGQPQSARPAIAGVAYARRARSHGRSTTQLGCGTILM